MFFEFSIKATRNQFMEPALHDEWKEFIAAYSYDHALASIHDRLKKAGWEVNEISGRRICILDIRDSGDHVTD